MLIFVEPFEHRIISKFRSYHKIINLTLNKKQLLYTWFNTLTSYFKLRITLRLINVQFEYTFGRGKIFSQHWSKKFTRTPSKFKDWNSAVKFMGGGHVKKNEESNYPVQFINKPSFRTFATENRWNDGIWFFNELSDSKFAASLVSKGYQNLQHVTPFHKKFKGDRKRGGTEHRSSIYVPPGENFLACVRYFCG